MTTEFRLRYIVRNAGWSPIYDLTVKDLSKPINIKYRALAFNDTGVDWVSPAGQVGARLFDADHGLMPEITTRAAVFGRDGHPQNVAFPQRLDIVPGILMILIPAGGFRGKLFTAQFVNQFNDPFLLLVEFKIHRS